VLIKQKLALAFSSKMSAENAKKHETNTKTSLLPERVLGGS
jgi:hypothetical protein